jgi:hypothetical protein
MITHTNLPAVRPIIFGVMLIVLVANSTAGAAPDDPFRPTPPVQQQIANVVAAIVRVGEGGDRSALPDQIARLERLAGDREALLLELAWYLSRASGTEQSMGAALLVDHLNFTDDEKIAAIVAQLGSSDGAWLHALTDLLSTVDRPRGGDPDFSPYEPLLRQAAGPPEGLVDYLFGVSRGEALSTLTRVYLRDESRRDAVGTTVEAVERVLESWQSGVVPTPAAQRETIERLDLLSRNESWWVRLYVAKTIRREPRLATPELADRLRQDEHPLVQQAARS